MQKLSHIPPSFLTKLAVSPDWINKKVQGANVPTARRTAFEAANTLRAGQMRQANTSAFQGAQGPVANRQQNIANWQSKNRLVTNRQTAANVAIPSKPIPNPALTDNKPRGAWSPEMRKMWDKEIGVNPTQQTNVTKNIRAAGKVPNPTSSTKVVGAPRPTAGVAKAESGMMNAGRKLRMPGNRGLAIAGGLLAAGGLGYAALHHHNAAQAQQ